MNNYLRSLGLKKSSFFLFGLKGSGKSTWCREHFPSAHWVNLLDEGLYQDLLLQPGLLGMQLHALPSESKVVIDEVQRLPNLLNEVHRFIEEKKFQFVLTGSSTRKLKKAGVNLLAGRALSLQMFPLTPWELKEDFEISKVLEIGSLPIIFTDEDPVSKLKAYVQVYLKEEIQAEALARNLQGFSRFLSIAALCHAQLCNVSSIARESAVNRSTVADYFSILEDTQMGFFLPAYEAKLRIRERLSPKWVWTDPGIVRTLKKHFGPVHQEEKGSLFEGWFISCLRAWNSYHGEPWHTISYWSSLEKKQTEVDLILEGQNGITAIEIKSSTRIRPEMFHGLDAIKTLKGLRHRILVYLGDKKLQTEDGVVVYPLSQFLEEIESFS